MIQLLYDQPFFWWRSSFSEINNIITNSLVLGLRALSVWAWSDLKLAFPFLSKCILLNENFKQEILKYMNEKHKMCRSLGESMIFHTYNRFRISDSSKDFLESYGESAWFSSSVRFRRITGNHSGSARITARSSVS